MQEGAHQYRLRIEYEPISDDDGPLYSKQVLKKTNSLFIAYATMDATSFVYLEYHQHTIVMVHHCTPSGCNSYFIHENPLRFAFENIYSFKMQISGTEIVMHTIHRNLGNECNSKTLIQTRGFCYYHAVLHGLLMSDTMRRLCCQALFKYMGTLSATAPHFSLGTFMDTDICENFSIYKSALDKNDPEYTNTLMANAKYFTMKFFYQYLFHFDEIANKINDARAVARGEKPHPVEVLAHHEPNKIRHKGDLQQVPESGNPLDVCMIILTDILDLTVVTQKDNEVAARAINPKDIVVYTKNYEQKNGLGAAKKDAPIKRPMLGKASSRQPTVPTAKDHPTILPGHDHTLAFAVITIYFFDNSGLSKREYINTIPNAHAVVGVICDGEYRIVDSRDSTSLYYTCQWTDVSAIRKNYANMVFPNKDHNITNIRVDYYYINPALTATVEDTCRKIKAVYIDPRIYKRMLNAPLDESYKARIDPFIRGATEKAMMTMFPPLVLQNQQGIMAPSARPNSIRTRR